jgi:glycosyltransferase involved in cell wall biosynthesis
MKKKNLLFIIPEMSMGGAQRSLANISEHLRQFYTIYVVVFNRNHQVSNFFNHDLLSLDVVPGKSAVAKIAAFKKRIVRLRSLKKKLQIDVSVSFLEGADYVNILSRQADKVILSIRGSKLHDENMHSSNFRFRKWFIKRLYERADSIVCVNQGIASELKNDFGILGPDIRVVYNFYDLARIEDLANTPLEEFKSIFEFPVIMMSGRLAIEKGTMGVLTLFHKLRQVNPDLKLVLVGDGPMLAAVRSACTALGLRCAFRTYENEIPDVLITGEQTNVYQLLSKAKCYVLNSSSEGFPNGLAEAMACGLPVVAGDCPYGPREILAPETPFVNIRKPEFAPYGVLLPVSAQTNLDIWFESVSKLLADDPLRSHYAQQGRKRIAEFNRTSAIDSWRNVIEN